MLVYHIQGVIIMITITIYIIILLIFINNKINEFFVVF